MITVENIFRGLMHVFSDLREADCLPEKVGGQVGSYAAVDA